MVHRDASALLTESHNDSGHQDEQDEIIGNQQLGVEAPIEYQTAPADVDGYDFKKDSRNGCFACKYCRKAASGIQDDVGMWTNEGVQDAYTDMCQLISENYGTVSNTDLFDMVSDFYESHIRTLYDYGEWSKDSIANHIIFHGHSEDVHMSECTSILFSQIQSLRQKTWIKNNDTGQLEPHAKNLHLLERYVKLLDDHLMKRKTIKKS